jgi:L-malate glycosyltransferase
MPTPRIPLMLTVLIATYNRVDVLRKSLNAYCQLRRPEGGWKLVIVDNGSSDATKEIIHSFVSCLPLTYAFEPARGKNAALNLGLASAEGDLIVFSDDDVFPRPDWLIEMRRSADAHRSYSIFGGAVVAQWETYPQDWILQCVPLGPAFAVTDPSWEEGPIEAGFAFGANMAIRAEIFDAGYRFSVDIGPGRACPMGSETELNLRLVNAGFKAWHNKRAVVDHCISKFKMQRSWVLKRALEFGREQYRLTARYEHANGTYYLGIPSQLIKAIARMGSRVGAATLAGDSAELFRKRWKFNYLIGQAIEARMLSVRASNPRQPTRSPEPRLRGCA